VIDERDLFERAATWFDPPGDILERMGVRRDRRRRNRRIRSAALALVVALLVVAGLLKAFAHVAQRTPAVKPPTGTVLFSRSTGEPETHLYAIGPDGVLRRFDTRGTDSFTISPDGSQVLYADDDPDRTDEILPAVIDLDGSHQRLLRSSVPVAGFGPQAWSPDGTRFVGWGTSFAHPSATGLYTARASDGGDLLQVTSPSGRRYDNAIAYSPDGSKILFLRPTKDVAGAPGRTVRDLFVVNVDGSGLLRLNPPGVVIGPTDGGVVGTPSPSRVLDARVASWSPDGTQVAVAAVIGTPKQARTGQVQRGLFVVYADGTNAHQIVPSAQILDAQWSPDGRWIAFTEANPDHPDIFIVHPDGTGLQALTSSSDGLASWGPVWAPDGSAVLFNRNPGQDPFDSELWFVNVDGSDLTQLTHTPGYYLSYAWSPATRTP
jgi:TolB protein